MPKPARFEEILPLIYGLGLDEPTVSSLDGDEIVDDRGNHSQLVDPTPGPETLVVEKDTRAELLRFLEQLLTPNEWFVLTKHVGLDGPARTFKEIGEAHDPPRSESWAWALGKSAIQKLQAKQAAEKIRQLLS